MNLEISINPLSEELSGKEVATLMAYENLSIDCFESQGNVWDSWYRASEYELNYEDYIFRLKRNE